MGFFFGESGNFRDFVMVEWMICLSCLLSFLL